MEFSTIIVSEPNWKPLERLFSHEECAAFMYMGRVGTIEQYKHRDTRRYLNIDAYTGEFHLPRGNNGYMKVSKAAALAYVFG
jgi:hypothetical protein